MKNRIVLLALFVIFLSSCQSSMNRFTQNERDANTYSSDETDIVGGLLGTMADRAVEENATAETGFEFLFKLSNGQTKAFVQKFQQGLRVSDQVHVIQGGQTARLTRQ